MKRSASELSSESKRRKTEPCHDAKISFDDPALEISPSEISANGVEPGYLHGTIFMTWPPARQRKLALIETKQISRGKKETHRIEVAFEDQCVPFLDKFNFKPRDEIYVSLKGAQVEHPTTKSFGSSGTLSMRLRFMAGVHLKYISISRNVREEFDTWELSRAMDENEKENRTSTIQEEPLPHLMENEPVQHVTLSQSTDHTVLQHTNSNIQVDATSDVASSSKKQQTSISPEPIANLSKKQLKRLRRGQKKNTPQEPDPLPAATAQQERESDNEEKQTTPAIPIPQDLQQPMQINALSPVPPTSPPSNSTKDDHVSPVKSGLDLASIGIGKYHTLNKIQVGFLANLIGVVRAISAPSIAKSGDWKCSIHLIDPSNPGGIMINCFTKKYKQWLPSANQGDILILRDVKIVKFKDTPAGTGYHDKLKWAVYKQDSGLISHGNLEGVPLSEKTDENFGIEVSPFYHPQGEEIKHCVSILDWYREYHKKSGHVYAAEAFVPKQIRQHRLLKELGSEIFAGEYFDCTVEVVRGYSNENGVYDLYITDYSENMSFKSTDNPKGSYSAPTHSTMKMELWDAASRLGPTMIPGAIYSINNARMNSYGGFITGKVQEQKIYRLDKEKNAENVHLKALLERKKGFHNPTSSFKHCLLNEVVPEVFFQCTVELLRVIISAEEPSFIHITDYTPHPKLAASDTDGSWSQGLKDSVTKVALLDINNELAPRLEVGSYYRISNLRIRYVNNMFRGSLGGQQRLIEKLNHKGSDDQHLLELLQRKEEWKKSLHPDPPVANTSSIPPVTPPPPKKKCISIKDMEAVEQNPNLFRLAVRVVDFFPLDLRDSVISHCSHCKKRLPTSQKACLNCIDNEHEFVKHEYQLWLELEDEQGSAIKVSVNNDCSIFRDLERVHLRDNHQAYNKFYQRIKPLIGDLDEKGDDIEDSDLSGTPLLQVVVNRWNTSTNKTAYGLAFYEGTILPSL